MRRSLRIALALAASAWSLRLARAQETVRVGWTIPAEEAKYWLMRRPEQLAHLGSRSPRRWASPPP